MQSIKIFLNIVYKDPANSFFQHWVLFLQLQLIGWFYVSICFFMYTDSLLNEPFFCLVQFTKWCSTEIDMENETDKKGSAGSYDALIWEYLNFAWMLLNYEWVW